MSRAELAEAVAKYLWRHTGRQHALDAHTIARYERGAITWPSAPYRTALRSVLGAATDADLGFRPARRRVPPTAGEPPATRDERSDRHSADDGRVHDPDSYPSALAGLMAADRLHDADRVARDTVRLARAVDDGLSERRGRDRTDLLRTAVRVGEFAAYLFRDQGDRRRCRYWHDRANDWAQQSEDPTLEAFVMLRKSQAAYDDRDAQRMGGLCRTAIGRLDGPSLLRAELVQQAARADAMLGASESPVRRALDRVRAEIEASAAPDPGSGGHDYGHDRLDLHSALCMVEAGRPDLACALYAPVVEREQRPLDRAYYTVLMAVALGLAGRPDAAARAASTALPVAVHGRSVRTLREAGRLEGVLAPWAGRRDVVEFRAALRSTAVDPDVTG